MQLEATLNINLDASEPLVAAINNLAAAIGAGNAVAKAATTSRKKETAKETVAQNGPSSPATYTAPEAAAQETPAVAAVSPSGTTAASDTKKEEVTVEQVRAAIAALAKTDREKALAILKERGAESVSALKPEHYEDVLKEATGG